MNQSYNQLGRAELPLGQAARQRRPAGFTVSWSQKSAAALVLSALCLATPAAGAAPIPVASAHKDADGATLKMNPGILKLQVFSSNVVRIVYAPGDSLPKLKSFSVIARPKPVRWTLADNPDDIRLTTEVLEVRVNRATGAIGFYDHAGRPLLVEPTGGGKSLTPHQVANFNTLQSRQDFVLAPDEAVYGLGQHPQGRLNYRGLTVHLQQENRVVALPVLVSSRGYGVLWDNPAVTDVDAGKSDRGTLTWTSEAADAIDYYFLFGPELDDVVAAYRHLTGAAPMFPKWSWGFWQCRERYSSQPELLGVVAEYRRRGVPLDGIIQDWQYWKPGRWGSHEFDPARYPDPTAMVNAVHTNSAHIIISVWPRFDPGLMNLAELEKAGAVFPLVHPNVYPQGRGKWYDPFNAKGRRIYWRQISRKLFARGFDGWWLDASEPELAGHWGEMRELTTAAGPGAKVFNAYPLLHTTGIYQGQRAESSAKRVFILTRSAYPGQQRNSAVTWSGDTQGKWEIFANQIPAGLNFVVTGIPYWNTDIGGFFGGSPADARYAELFTRWFQFGAFCPMFRVHGTGRPKEIWRFDEPTQQILADYIRLRYHLLPYIYSVSWMVTSESYTLMRPLVMDFRHDTNVFNVADQFMFGPALMACPVVQPGLTEREVYLPAGTDWTDFWTGELQPGGQSLSAAPPLGTMPIFVRAGSIIPYGPALQFAGEKPADPIELRVYRGADGSFTLYEDEGDNYNYERGAHATIPFQWDDRKQELTIRGAYRKIPWDAQGTHLQRRLGFAGPRHRRSSDRKARRRRSLLRPGADGLRREMSQASRLSHFNMNPRNTRTTHLCNFDCRGNGLNYDADIQSWQRKHPEGGHRMVIRLPNAHPVILCPTWMQSLSRCAARR
jgi:alpha-D-xyloside xylohydrolase